MAYYTGTANDMAALRQALVDACVLEGWIWNGATEVLSKGAMFLRLQVVSGYLTLLGRTSATEGDAPNVVRIGQIGAQPVTFPLAYEICAFPAEVYMVINYSVDYYQWCAFGQSTVQAMPGTGMFVAATTGDGNAASSIRITAAAGGGESSDVNLDRNCPAPFWATTNPFGGASRSYFVHSDLDGGGWHTSIYGNDARPGVGCIAPLISVLPNSWNSEAVLLPIRVYKFRPSNKVSLIVDLEHARYTRIDSYVPGEIITLGSDRWRVFPFYRKDASARGGGDGISHTGTFGWAIRYEGP